MRKFNMAESAAQVNSLHAFPFIISPLCLQLFARLGAKQSLGTLDLPLFSSLPSPGGVLCPGDVVELIGEEGSGKTETLLNITAQCVLPCSWHGREMGGKEVEVVWMCTDYKFDVLRLVAVLEGKVIARGEKTIERCFQFPSTHRAINSKIGTQLQHTVHSASSKDADLESDYRTLITSCLSRVHIINCNSSTELGVTLQSLRQSFLPAHPYVCALVLDNVAEFYWVDRADAGSMRGSDIKQSVWANALHRLVEDHHLVIFAARPLLFAQKPTTSQRDKQISEDRGQGKVECSLFNNWFAERLNVYLCICTVLPV